MSFSWVVLRRIVPGSVSLTEVTFMSSWGVLVGVMRLRKIIAKLSRTVIPSTVFTPHPVPTISPIWRPPSAPIASAPIMHVIVVAIPRVVVPVIASTVVSVSSLLFPVAVMSTAFIDWMRPFSVRCSALPTASVLLPTDISPPR